MSNAGSSIAIDNMAARKRVEDIARGSGGVDLEYIRMDLQDVAVTINDVGTDLDTFNKKIDDVVVLLRILSVGIVISTALTLGLYFQ